MANVVNPGCEMGSNTADGGSNPAVTVLCAICKEGQQTVLACLPCGHVSHLTCLQSYVKTFTYCPTCSCDISTMIETINPETPEDRARKITRVVRNLHKLEEKRERIIQLLEALEVPRGLYPQYLDGNCPNMETKRLKLEKSIKNLSKQFRRRIGDDD